ncbi:glutathione S-transferase [Salipiger bermudensis]|uniref:glutathione S-transferase n=1 Tax=Salipiger bermudensis TaxID=344736 RepID=UPI001C994DE5|nr:glutathione S-transferase [Salipiger bermudensis]MBY6002559.1 glutathione S-transferase [Salipiger bermudensis]
MTNRLFLGDYTYSSWSLRGWLLFERFGLPVSVTRISFLDGPVADQLSEIAPARTVPCLLTEDGALVWDSLAIAEELASRYPDAGIWPAEPRARASARSMCAEMHSSYGALREQCPMNLSTAYRGFEPSPETRADLARIEALWSLARERFGGNGPWLFGTYSAADAFFAPVAARIAGYGLALGSEARAYVAAHLADPAFRRWRAMGLARNEHLPWYDRDYTPAPWPGPAPRPARAVPSGPSENALCPYSGDPVTEFLEIDGRVFGFCNAFCRDKTLRDPEAWPAFAALLQTRA